MLCSATLCPLPVGGKSKKNRSIAVQFMLRQLVAVGDDTQLKLISYMLFVGHYQVMHHDMQCSLWSPDLDRVGTSGITEQRLTIKTQQKHFCRITLHTEFDFDMLHVVKGLTSRSFR